MATREPSTHSPIKKDHPKVVFYESANSIFSQASDHLSRNLNPATDAINVALNGLYILEGDIHVTVAARIQIAL